jgi:hypothetical protein
LSSTSLIRLSLLALALVAAASAHAQELPMSATPRGVVFAFLTETASSIDTIDRAAFRSRLVGDFTNADPRSFKGMLPAGSRLRIDSIPDLASTPDGLHHVAAYVTVETGGAKENWYFFCSGDSLWRIEGLRRFPTPTQRAQIRESLNDIDTTNATYRLLRSDLQRIILPDDSLRALFKKNRADAEKLTEPLRRGKLWSDFAIRDVDFSHLEEYRELDDDIAEDQLIFYTIDRGSLERLKRTIGLRRIERDDTYPGVILFVAGVIEKASYGYLYAADPADLPPISNNGFITLKPIGEGWWLYKRVR